MKKRRMVKCYFDSGTENSKCVGYIPEATSGSDVAAMLLQGRVTRFEEWLLLPVNWDPQYRNRSQVIKESRHAMSASMSKSTQAANVAAARFYPESVVV